MKYIICLLFFQTLLFSQSKSSYASVEKVMNEIPESETYSSENIAAYIQKNFSTQQDQIKAAYYYVIATISYDVTFEFTLNLVISEEDMNSKTINTKKGVCIHYAYFFKDIVQNLGYNCYLISGYTKQNQKLASLSHAWCGMQLEDNKWYIFDPTWDSGVIINGKFVRKITSNYFQISPEQSIKDHMPFDYIWQFLKNPYTEEDFISGKQSTNSVNTYILFERLIATYSNQSQFQNTKDLKLRMEATGITSKLAKERYDLMIKQLEVFNMNSNLFQFQAITDEYNAAIKMFNDFITYRNNQFKPLKSDNEINTMIAMPLRILENCQTKIYKIGFVGQDNLYELNQFKRALIAVIEEAKTHKIFVDDYLKADKRERKRMF
ncbi:transglutaminase domain-containing protein [Flavobacterium sp.]|uniref:transglutaminase domain-containing protein n=1 Tax=Flavobacterium sp. TaxID=239 RepID=UPI003F69888F